MHVGGISVEVEVALPRSSREARAEDRPAGKGEVADMGYRVARLGRLETVLMVRMMMGLAACEPWVEAWVNASSPS
jgi:hypothetical protein